MKTLGIRFGLVAIILFLIGFVSTNFNLWAILNLALTALMISIALYLIKSILDEETNPTIRGIINFFVATIIIYLFTGLVYAAAVAAFIIGLLEIFLLTRI